MIWHAVPVDAYPKKGKSTAQTKLKPAGSDFEAIKNLSHPREVRLMKVERRANQACDHVARLSRLDLAVLLHLGVTTVDVYLREYALLNGRQLPFRVNLQLIGSGHTRKLEIIGIYPKGCLVPAICQGIDRSQDAIEHCVRDYESVEHPSSALDVADTIARALASSDDLHRSSSSTLT